MGCINSGPVIKVKSIKSFKKAVKKNIKNKKENESENLEDKVFSFSDFTIDTDDSNSFNEQSQIKIDAHIENNELIFV